MSSAKVFSLFGASILRRQRISPSPIPPLRFTRPVPFPNLQFRLYSSAAAVDQIKIDTTETAVNSHHPWPEWVTFVDRLKTKGYFHGEGDEINDGVSSDGVLYKDMRVLKDACLSFARDRFDIFKSLSRQDIQAVVEKGCPNLFRKAVNSGKRLRAYIELDEGDVCGGCNLRGSCDKAYVVLKESESAARTVDIVRILLLYALDPVVISGEEKPHGRELIEASARKLLSKLIELSDTAPSPDLPKPTSKDTHKKGKTLNFVDDERTRDVEMKRGDWMCSKEDGPKRASGNNVEMKKGDWLCPDCSFMNFSRNVRCLHCKAEGPKRISIDEVEMKKGDWNCPQCSFMNFSSNRKCLRCQEQRPKRELNPGEWECPSCDFLNYRKNVECKKCSGERPKEPVEAKYEDQLWKRPY
ncbi:hypothetical protein LguiB_007515 [Lonicera macranthoides]